MKEIPKKVTKSSNLDFSKKNSSHNSFKFANLAPKRTLKDLEKIEEHDIEES